MGDFLIDSLLLLLVLVGTVLVWSAVWRRCPAARVAYAVYVLSYLVTSAVGAAFVSMPGGLELLAEVNASANLRVLVVRDALSFWLMIYSPLIVPGVVLIWRAAWSNGRADPSASWLRLLYSPVDIAAFIITAALTIAFCLFSFYRAGYIGIFGEIFKLETDFDGLMMLRSRVFNGLGQIALGLIYVGLPTLSFLALHRAAMSKALEWVAVCAAVVSITFVLQLMTVQKSIAVVFLLALAIGAYSLRLVRSWAIIIGAGFGIVGVTFMQELAIGDWSIADTLYLVFYRMASGTVAAVNIFPSVTDYVGIDLMLDVAGIGQSSSAPTLIYDYLYPGESGVQGFAPVPAHIAAYTEAGVLYGMVVLIAIGWAIQFAGTLLQAARRTPSAAIIFAIYMQSLVALYYLTQVSLRHVLISSYGIMWAFVVVVPLLLVQQERPSPSRRMG